MNVTSERIRELRRERGLTLEQVAQKARVGRSTVRKWEAGLIRNIRQDKMALLAKALDTTPEYLMGWGENAAGKAEGALVPMLGAIACGVPVFAENDFCGYVASAPSLHADFALRARGDSMTGARILDGDVVFIKKQESVENGEIAAVVIEDEATLKRVYKTADTLTLVAENPAYAPIVLRKKDNKKVFILGKAVAFQSSVR
ncbi:MAG: helix-turn-helix domain-containing protein [Clostridia bacterium]|nr:helix-turn-helix domain-containing protein [Clostridia bacterium]